VKKTMADYTYLKIDDVQRITSLGYFYTQMTRLTTVGSMQKRLRAGVESDTLFMISGLFAKE
jgi:hypothetical protein